MLYVVRISELLENDSFLHLRRLIDMRDYTTLHYSNLLGLVNLVGLANTVSKAKGSFTSSAHIRNHRHKVIYESNMKKGA